MDESMGLLWKGKGMHWWMVVQWKPTPVGRESHTTADCDTGAIIFVEPYEGELIMQGKEFVADNGANPVKALRYVKPWFGSGRCVILDSGFASLKCVKGMAKHGLFTIGNVKSAHVGFPKTWLVRNEHARGQRSSATTSLKTSTGETWSVLVACDRDKKPMALIDTAGSTSMGETLNMPLKIIR